MPAQLAGVMVALPAHGAAPGAASPAGGTKKASAVGAASSVCVAIGAGAASARAGPTGITRGAPQPTSAASSRTPGASRPPRMAPFYTSGNPGSRLLPPGLVPVDA